MEHRKNIYHQSESEIQREEKVLRQAIINTEAFAPIYEKYYLMIFKFVLQRVENEHVASEIVSDVFAKAIFNLKKYKFKGTPFSAWLYRVAYNEVIKTFRKQKKVRTVNIPESAWSLFKKEEEEDNIDNTISIVKLRECLKNLKPHEVTLIEMRFFEDLAFKEIGGILGLTTENARVKTHRTLKKIQKTFKSL